MAQLVKYGFERNKISLFRSHQNRLIQDRVSEEKAILANNNPKKVDAFSSEITPVEIQNFDIFYGQFEHVHTEGEGRSRKVMRTMRRYDVPAILAKKLGSDYANITYFIRARGIKMKSAEHIHILNYFYKNKSSFIQLLQEEPQLFHDTIIKGLAQVNIYQSEELIKLVRLSQAFNIEDLSVWKNLLIKGNLLLQNQSEVESVLENICFIFKILASVPFTDLNSQGLLLQMKKRILRSIPLMDVSECVQLLQFIANKKMFIDENQLRKFEDKFLINQELLTTQQFAIIFDSFGMIGFNSNELLAFYLKWRWSKLNRIIKAQVIDSHTSSNLQEIAQSAIKEKEKEEEEDVQSQEQVLSSSQYNSKTPTNSSQSISPDIQIDHFIYLIRGFSVNQVSSINEELWLKVEQMIINYYNEFGKQGQINVILPQQYAQIIISVFSHTKLGSSKIWQLLQNRGELDLSYDENYIILRHLNNHNIQSISQLNLALSYILDDSTDLPMFENVLGKEPAAKILEKLETYAMVIYKYIETYTEKQNFAELKFQKRCMEELLHQSVTILLSNVDRRWKDLTERECIKLYGLLHLCEHKSGYTVTSKISALERSIQKERHLYGMKEVAFLTLMQEAFASEEQYSKWSNFIFKCIQNASQLEFATYLKIFYKHGLGDLYIWNLLQVKFIEQMELFNVKDLLIGMLIFMQKIEIDEEIWELFIEVLKIKVHTSDLEILSFFSQQIEQMEYKKQIDDLIVSLNANKNNEQDAEIDEEQDFQYFESQGLTLEFVSEKQDPLCVHSSASIRYVLNLIE